MDGSAKKQDLEDLITSSKISEKISDLSESHFVDATVTKCSKGWVYVTFTFKNKKAPVSDGWEKICVFFTLINSCLTTLVTTL